MPNSNDKCFLIGDTRLLSECGEMLVKQGYNIRGLLTSEPGIANWGHKHGLAVFDSIEAAKPRLDAEPFDFLFSIGNLRMIPESLLELPRKLAINFHDGPLPRYAGLHATSWALLNGESRHGVTWHVMTSRPDEGDILKQAFVDIAEGETAFSLNTKCLKAGIDSFRELVTELSAGTFARIKQDLGSRSYFARYKRPEAAGCISWDWPAEKISALVRALDFGDAAAGYVNPLGMAKLMVGGECFAVAELEVQKAHSTASPGTVLAMNDEGFTVATSTLDVMVRRLLDMDGRPLTDQDHPDQLGLSKGRPFTSLADELKRKLDALYHDLVKHEAFWVGRLAGIKRISMPYRRPVCAASRMASLIHLSMPVPPEVLLLLQSHHPEWKPADFLSVAFAAYLSRITGEAELDVGLTTEELCREMGEFEGLFARSVPVKLELKDNQSLEETFEANLERWETTKRRKTYPLDVAIRYPALRTAAREKGCLLPVGIIQSVSFEDSGLGSGHELAIVIPPGTGECGWVFDPGVFERDDVSSMLGQFQIFLGGFGINPGCAISRLPLLNEDERRKLLVEWNDTACEVPNELCVHEAFERQVERTPAATALVFQEDQLTYQELDERANRLARHLCDLGVGPDVLVGIAMERSIEMMVGLLGILKAGGAYLPLDPNYPKERLAFIAADAGLSLILTQAGLAESLPQGSSRKVILDETYLESLPLGGAVANAVEPGNLAYVLYTSGSTGNPKGVMVTHHNVVSFFTAMDERIGNRPAGVWLAATSIAFDISVLELFWTLARGFKVVIHAERTGAHRPAAASAAKPADTRTVDFSLFYFSAEEGDDPHQKYRLLLEGARFADRRGFAAVWTPERHFHSFGGLYPNPAVIGAALATITERVAIRAGSVVLPLHQTARVAEEWSVVDNLSRGRVGISFASGWHPQDFALSPHNFAERKRVMFSEIATFRALWRGETIALKGGDGKDFEVRVFPSPIQREVPVWVTAAGHPDTFRNAGELGFNILTHLLGQTIEELAEKIQVYREGWKRGGHGSPAGQVTLMLHTFVGQNLESVRREVRIPFMRYLESSVDLIRHEPQSFPTLKPAAKAAVSSLNAGFQELREEDRKNLLGVAFERYFATSGLFGTPDDCLKMVEKVRAIGVSEIACLIDFGVGFDAVMGSLELLDQVRQRSGSRTALDGAEYSIPCLIRRHNVTHFQCTPSHARMLADDPDTLSSLGRLNMVLLGGEPLPPSLLETLRSVVRGEIHNMYGPTETTVWSSSQRCAEAERTITIGRPIANTSFYVADQNLQLTPVGVAGELLIGGLGVTRGYLNRPELTAEKFIKNPFDPGSAVPLYRTGDLVRYRPDGKLECLGRLDQQIKLRGHRIELGEIEVVLGQHRNVAAAVVSVYQDASFNRSLVAYYVPGGDTEPPLHAGNGNQNPHQVASMANELRSFLEARLPGHMVPASFVALEALPMTPNGKINRHALPAPERSAFSVDAERVAPRSPMEQELVRIWEDILGVRPIGVRDNFFRLGGDSILTVRVLIETERVFGQMLDAAAFFQVPTVEKMAELLRRNGNHKSSEPADSAECLARPGHELPEVSSRIRLLSSEDLDRVVDIHIERFPGSRSTELGRRYLKRMYRWFLTEHPQLALVATFDGKVVGFTTGSIGGYGRLVFRYCFVEIVLGLLLRPRQLVRSNTFFLWKSYLKAFVPGRWLKTSRSGDLAQGVSVSNASLAVTKAAPGDTGISLLMAFENSARRLGAALLRGSTLPGNIRAREVFEGLGWQAYAQTSTTVSYAKKLSREENKERHRAERVSAPR